MDKAPSTSIVRSFRVNFQKDPEVFSYLVANEAAGGDFSTLIRGLLLSHIASNAPEYLDHDQCKRVYLSKLESYVQTLKAEVESGGVPLIVAKPKNRERMNQAETVQTAAQPPQSAQMAVVPPSSPVSAVATASQAPAPSTSRPKATAPVASVLAEMPKAVSLGDTSSNTAVGQERDDDLVDVGGYGSAFLANS